LTVKLLELFLEAQEACVFHLIDVETPKEMIKFMLDNCCEKSLGDEILLLTRCIPVVHPDVARSLDKPTQSWNRKASLPKTLLRCIDDCENRVDENGVRERVAATVAVRPAGKLNDGQLD